VAFDFVDQLKSSVDIVAVVGEYVRLKKAGASPRWVGLCPFHTEKSPSFGVHSTRQFYKCFGCGAAGDVLKFVMEIEGLSFYEALKALAERHGIPMPKRHEYSDPESRLRASVGDLQELAAKQFRENLAGPKGAEARAYLQRRGVTPQVAEEFMLGYSEGGGQQLARLFEKQGVPRDQLEKSGLVMARQEGGGWFDRFRNRLMFPIHGETGKVIAFAGRALGDDNPKYLNSPETPIYQKSHVLYNLHRAKAEARKLDFTILVEGYMDVIGVSAAGIRGVVASCGTALTNQQVRMLKRHSEKVIVNFDPDNAGAGATERSIQLFIEEGMRIRVLELDGGLDPDEYVKERGASSYRDRLMHSKGYFHWLADRARTRFDMRDSDGRMQAFKWLLPNVQRVGEKLERLAVVNDIAFQLGVEPGPVLEQFRKAAVDRKTAEMRPENRETQVTDAERTLLRLLLSEEDVRESLGPHLASLGQLERLATRRILETIGAMIQGGGRFSYGDLEARLDEAGRKLLGLLTWSEEDPARHRSALPSVEQAANAWRDLNALGQKADRARLRARIREATSAGRHEEALSLIAELDGQGPE